MKDWCSRSGNGFQVKTNTKDQKRTCTAIAKNNNGVIVGYATITQDPVPVKYIPGKNSYLSGDYCKFSYSHSNISSFIIDKEYMVYNKVATNPSSFTFYVSANPSTNTIRRTDIAVKNSAGGYLELIRVQQAAFSPKVTDLDYNSDPRTLTYALANVELSKTEITNKSMCSVSSPSLSKYSIKLTQNTSDKPRSCTVIFKNTYGTVLAKYNITQSGVPVTTVKVVGAYSTMGYCKSGAKSLTAQNKDMVYNIKCTSLNNFTYSISANPSDDKRYTDIIVKNSDQVYIEILRIEQSRFVPPISNQTFNANSRTITLSCPHADISKTSYSYPNMCNTGKALGGDKFQFKLTQNQSNCSRSNTITFFDKYGSPLAKCTIKQEGLPFVIIDVDGTTTKASYTNAKATSFDINDTSVVTATKATSNGNFTFTLTCNPSTTKSRSVLMAAKDGNGVYLELIWIEQKPHTHAYTYTTTKSSHTYSRKCKYCSDCDKNISYKEYLKYYSKSDNADSVRTYMGLIGYDKTNKADKKNYS